MEARYLTDLEWRICHAINIYVYRNGMDGESPVLVHIPPAKKKNMRTVLSAIQDRVSFPVGYPTQLYRMDGRRVRHPCELEQYNNYVVSSNYDKHFKCVQYGRKKSPLLVLNRDSKHIRVLRLQNSNYRDWMMKKEATVEERPFAPHFYPPLYANETTSNTPLGNQGRGNSGVQPQDYIVQKCEVVTDNPEANEALLRLQEKAAETFEAFKLKYPVEIDFSKSETLNVPNNPEPIPNEPTVKPITPQPQPIKKFVDAFEQYRLPRPPTEFHTYDDNTEAILSNFSNAVNGNYVPDRPFKSYENFHDIKTGAISDGSSSSFPNDSCSMSYEDLRAQNRYLIQRAKRKDRKLKKLMERNSSLMLARRLASLDSEDSEPDSIRYVSYRTSRRDVSYKPSRSILPKKMPFLVLPPPPPPFRDECVSCLPTEEDAQAAIAQLEFFVRHQNPDDYDYYK